MSSETINFSGKINHIADVYIDAMQNVEGRYNSPPELPLLSLPEISRKVWGLRRKKMVIVAGRPSQGKSSVLLQLALDLALQGKTIVFFTYEMTTQVCIERAVANYCEIDSFDLLTGKVVNKGEAFTKKRNDFYEKIKPTNFLIVEGFGKTFSELMHAIETLKRPIDAIFIDYVQMISIEKGKTRKDSMDEYMRALRDYAITKNFCAIVASQINRGTHDGHKIREPEMWEMKGSGELEEVADMVWLVHWNYKYSHDENERNKYCIHIAKNRDGRTGRMDNLIYIPEFLKIKEANNESGNSTTRSYGTPYAQD